MKTPEELAEEFFENWQPEKPKYKRPKARQYALEKITECFVAGYQAAMDQLADAGKVINSPKKLDSWISVKDRLPNLEKTSRSLRRESSCILLVSYGNVYVAHLCEDWTDRSHFIFAACTCNCRAFDMEIDGWELDQVSHWMPLPKPPEDK